MIYIFVSIIVIALILFISSHFMDDKYKDLEEQVEQLSITTMQDTYQMKKKLKILEEELLTDTVQQETPSFEHVPPSLKDKPLLIQKVYHLHQQGYTLDDISKQTNLSNHDVQTILKNNI